MRAPLACCSTLARTGSRSSSIGGGYVDEGDGPADRGTEGRAAERNAVAPGILERFCSVTEIGVNTHGERHLEGDTGMETKSILGIVMGIVIIIADLYWTYKDFQSPTFLALGIIIFIASLVWIGLDWSLSMQAKPNAATM